MVSRQLGRQNRVRVTQVDLYDVPDLHSQFIAKREEFSFVDPVHGTKTIWVFHGTREENIRPIMTGGFKVGGIDVEVANGRAFGTGVYTAVGPRTPMAHEYSRGANKVILAQALVGRVDEDSFTGPDWAPDWRIYKTKEQLLPR